MSEAPATIKVLLVEDDARLAQLTSRYLEGHGVVVTHASDGIEGQNEALRRQYDCVVLDLMLPGREGIEVCRQLTIARAHGGELSLESVPGRGTTARLQIPLEDVS